MQAGITSLWSLLEVERAVDGGGADRTGVADQVVAWVRRQGGVELSLESGALLLDGDAVVGGIDTFAAVHGLRCILGDQGIRLVALAPHLTSAAVIEWAQAIVAGRLPTDPMPGVRIELLREPGAGTGPVAWVDRGERAGAEVDSRLRAVFLQHSLIAGLPTLVGVRPDVAKAIVEGVVDRLLRLSHGLEPLILLQQDEALLRRSTAVAVFAACFAHHAGWPEEQLAELGVAGLLHDIGVLLDAEQPGPAGFRWLLERGADDCWLRSALVARRWRDRGDGFDNVAELRGVLGLVRLAVAASDAGDVPACQRRLLAAADGGAVPLDLLTAAQAAISSGS